MGLSSHLVPNRLKHARRHQAEYNAMSVVKVEGATSYIDAHLLRSQANCSAFFLQDAHLDSRR